MTGSKKCAFRRHNATRNVHFAGTTRSMCSTRYREPVDIKVLTVSGSVWEFRPQTGFFGPLIKKIHNVVVFGGPFWLIFPKRIFLVAKNSDFFMERQ